jgi:thiol:disulfide interchange protein DsbD
MGLVAGIVAAPCTGPPLAALLVFVSTQRSVFIGGSLLFTYALGMGVLFFVIAGFALKLPKSGAWMDGVKAVFGVVMIVAALYYLRNITPLLRSFGKSSYSFPLSQVRWWLWDLDRRR